MSTIEIQKELIEKIRSTYDESVLEEVYKILELNTENFDKIVLTDFQKSKIDSGLKDMEDGNFISHEEANKQIEEWLKK
mgnify:FL=1